MMKYLSILPVLFFLTGPALAEQPASPGECFQMYRKQLHESETGQLRSDELMNFADRCMPNSVNSNDVHYYKRLQVNDNKYINTLKV
jgi:hypothetical protein